MKKNTLSDLSTLVSLCKQRGYIYPSSEIYGGLNSCWDYGPLGVNLKRNIKAAWWKEMTYREEVVGLDASILMHPQVWKASGHIDGFSDSLVDCKDCKNRFRLDHALLKDNKKTCPKCGSFSLTESRQFNLMFKTNMGPVEEEGSQVFLRPETAQGIFVNFDNVQKSTRKKLPFGIAQIGKSFRNEITPGNFIFRTREFEQMEMQYFVNPKEDERHFDFWKKERMEFCKNLGIKESHLRFTPHGQGELAHYAKAAFDIEYKFPFGWQEIEGIHNRSDFDLKQHQKFSGKKLEYFDDTTQEKFLPFVIETAIGCDRLCLAILCDAYTEEIKTLDNGKEDKRVYLNLHHSLAPYKLAILPLSKKEELTKIAKQLYADLSKKYPIDYDDRGSIGKRYRRQDEIGTPLCITVDFDSLEDSAITIRRLDTMEQTRVDLSQVMSYMDRLFAI
ncbi:MAG: glycine--tRNA ligase [Bdellovibrionaceae bacterium]|nr:glycine--tRNA ligase [Pseudobdellovibrionaceae bacterium]